MEQDLSSSLMLVFQILELTLSCCAADKKEDGTRNSTTLVDNFREWTKLFVFQKSTL